MSAAAGATQMMTVKTVAEARAAVAAARRAGRTIGFVPTMGALHRGHVSLMEAARADKHFTVVSIFVNPTQFGPREDLSKYPRPFEADNATCKEAGADLVFVPGHAEIYPPGDQTRVRPGRLAEALCGPFRPGHFEGVCTVVARLFNIVQPDAAYFGQKDAQQLAIIRRMTLDLRLPIEIVACPIVREPDGLAMSSRNAYLAPEDRMRSLCLYRALCAGREALIGGERSTGRIVAKMQAVIAAAGNVQIDYLSLVDPVTLEDIGESRPKGVLIAGAVRVGGTRLIDNMLVDLN